MADGYLEKRYEEVFGKGAKKTAVKHTSIETLMEKNRSYRGYQKDYVVRRDMLEPHRGGEHQNRLGKEPAGAAVQISDQGNGRRPHPAKHETRRSAARVASTLRRHRARSVHHHLQHRARIEVRGHRSWHCDTEHVAESHRNGLERHHDWRFQQGKDYRSF